MTLALDRVFAEFDRGAGRAASSSADGMTPLDILERIDRRTVRTPALELVSAAVVEAFRTPDARLIIVLPPQMGKSTTATRAGVLHALREDPTRRIVVASYADRIARRFGRMIRNDITGHQGRGGWDCGLRLAPDQKAAAEWELTAGGGVYAVGVGGALTSRSADGMVIDDPLKGRKAADSPTIRDDVWEWWESTAASRLQPGAPVVLILTRWHHSDLAGRLMAEQPGVWKLLHIPAQADPAVVDPDPLGRAPGEFLASAQGWTQEQWEARKRDAGDEWAPLHQGTPNEPGGEDFDVDKLRYWHPSRDRSALECGPRSWRLALDCWVFATVDTAESLAKSADYTVVSVWAIPVDGSLVLLDVARDRVPPHRQLELARPLVEKWRPRTIYVEPSMRTTQLVREAVQAGWHIEDIAAKGDKRVRATPAAKRIEQGRVWFPAEHPLRDEFVKELKHFPNGKHDDMTDTLSSAVRVLFSDYSPPAGSPPPPARSAVDDLGRAVDVPRGFDPMRAEF